MCLSLLLTLFVLGVIYIHRLHFSYLFFLLCFFSCTVCIVYWVTFINNHLFMWKFTFSRSDIYFAYLSLDMSLCNLSVIVLFFDFYSQKIAKSNFRSVRLFCVHDRWPSPDLGACGNPILAISPLMSSFVISDRRSCRQACGVACPTHFTTTRRHSFFIIYSYYVESDVSSSHSYSLVGTNRKSTPLGYSLTCSHSFQDWPCTSTTLNRTSGYRNRMD